MLNALHPKSTVSDGPIKKSEALSNIDFAIAGMKQATDKNMWRSSRKEFYECIARGFEEGCRQRHPSNSKRTDIGVSYQTSGM